MKQGEIRQTYDSHEAKRKHTYFNEAREKGNVDRRFMHTFLY